MHHIGDGAHRVQLFSNLFFNCLLRALPYFNSHAAFLLLGEKTVLIILFYSDDLGSCLANNARLLFRHRDIVNRQSDARTSRVVKTEMLHLVHYARHGVESITHGTVSHDSGERLLGDDVIYKWVVGGQDCIEEKPTDSRLKRVVLKCRVLLLPCDGKYLDLGPQIYGVVFGRENRRVWRCEVFAFSLRFLNRLGEPIEAEDNILRFRREHSHLPVAWFENILVRAHDILRLPLRLFRKRHMHGHLVAVEVRVKRVTDERVELDSVAFDKTGTEGLDALPVEGRCTVKKYILTGDRFFENFPHFGDAVFDKAPRAANVEREFAIQKTGDDEGTEELERHVIRQTAFIKLQVGAD